jgi:hypothetical protein
VRKICGDGSDVQREIEHFAQALKSYPEQFARNPKVSFEQHMFCVAMEHWASGTRERRTVSEG